MQSLTKKITKKIDAKNADDEKKLVKSLVSEFKDFKKWPAVDQLAATIALGRIADEIIWNNNIDKSVLMKLLGVLEPLRDEKRANEILKFGRIDEATEKFVLKQTAIPMENGKHLTLEHWLWLENRLFSEGPKEHDDELMGELEWLRKKSPSADVIEHVKDVLQELHKEKEQMRDQINQARGILA